MHRISPGAFALAISVALSLMLAGCSGGGGTAPSQVSVNALTADPQAFSGEIAVEGIVQDVAADSSLIVLIDLAEYETCGLTPCDSAGSLPLQVPLSGQPTPAGALYEGTLPALEDRVTAVGTVRSGADGLHFDVERITRGSETILTKRAGG